MNDVAGIPISRAKVTLPRRRDELLTRHRLLDLLGELLEKKLILLSAPAGYGKTSLLIDLANHTELPVCWLSLDELDRNPQRWLAYLIASIAERFPNFGAQSMSALEGMVSMEQDFEPLMVSLTNEIYDQIREHFILVLDDYHLVEATDSVRALANRFIRLADENCHVILSSRSLIDLPDLGWFISQNQVGGLDFAALSFLPREIQELVLQNYGKRISEDEAHSLAEKSEGWVTGLQLSGLGGISEHQTRIARASGMDLDGYFEQQAFVQLPLQARHLLLYTSLFEEFDIEICRSALADFLPEVTNWPELVSGIVTHNLYILPVGEDSHWFRYHHLYRDFLRSHLQREQPEQVRPILVSLMKAYENRGEWERAHQVCMQLNDSEMVAGLVERAGRSLIRRAVVTLSNWLNALPPALLNSRPGLLSLRGGIGYLRGDYREALELLNKAEVIYRATNEINGLAMTLLRQANVYRDLGDLSTSLRDTEESLELSKQAPELALEHIEALRSKGLCLFRLGQTRPARDYLERSLALSRHLGEAEYIPILLLNCGLVYRTLGENEAAQAAYLEALSVWRKQGNLAWQATLLNNLAALYLILGEYDKACSTYYDGLDCARRSRYASAEAMISIGLGDLYAELDETEGAHQAYQQAEETIKEIENHYLLNYLALTRANLFLNRGETSQAEAILLETLPRIEWGKATYEDGLWSLLRGRLSLTLGATQEAIELLEKANRLFSEDGRHMETVQSQVWLMTALAVAKNPGAGNMAQSLFASRATPAHTLIVALRHARPWLESLRSHPGLAQLLRRVDQFEVQLPALRRGLRRMPQTVSLAAPHLIIRGLGWTKVIVNGDVVEWPTRSVRELFFYFLTTPKPVTKEQVAQTLWPDIEEPARITQRFKNELYRLRRAVGQPIVVLEGELYRFNHALDYDFDAVDFDAYLAQARAATTDEAKVENLEKALGLVKGRYLADLDATWAMLDQEQFHQQYLAVAMELAEIYWKQNKYADTLRVVQQILIDDPTCEPAHQLAMRVHAKNNDRPALTRQYQACHDAMERHLGLDPSPDTEALYKKLTSG